jgi:hypothetical protein
MSPVAYPTTSEFALLLLQIDDTKHGEDARALAEDDDGCR